MKIFLNGISYESDQIKKFMKAFGDAAGAQIVVAYGPREEGDKDNYWYACIRGTDCVRFSDTCWRAVCAIMRDVGVGFSKHAIIRVEKGRKR